MNKQTLTALGLLLTGVAVFGFLASRTTPATQPVESEVVPAGEFVEEGDYTSISVQYPEARQSVRSAIEADMQQLVATFKQNANADNLTAEDVQIMGLSAERKFTLMAQFETRTSPDYDSYAYIIYEDMLGAHPNAYFKTFVFDKEGNRVSLAQLFPNNPEWLDDLAARVLTDVTEQYKARTGAEGIDTTIYGEGVAAKEENFQNFVVDGEMLTILIPPYQVAAYAAGPFEVTIPLAELQ